MGCICILHSNDGQAIPVGSCDPLSSKYGRVSRHVSLQGGNPYAWHSTGGNSILFSMKAMRVADKSLTGSFCRALALCFILPFVKERA